MLRSLLERTTVGDILALRPSPAPEPVSERAPLPVLMERFSSSSGTCLPVLTGDGNLAGVVSLRMVQQTLGQGAALANLVVARDLATPAVTVGSRQSLYSALAKMSRFDCKELLVLDEAQPEQPKVVAVLTSGDINAIYDEQLLNPPSPVAGNSPLRRVLRRLIPWASKSSTGEGD